MAIDLTDFINSIKALNKTNKRLFFNTFFEQQADADSLTAEEITAQEQQEIDYLKNVCSQMFAVTVPVNVTVSQIQTYLNKWVDDRAEKLKEFVADITKFKQLQVLEATANGNDVKAWLRQAIKIYSIYRNCQ